jgi:hypothetical protein
MLRFEFCNALLTALHSNATENIFFLFENKKTANRSVHRIIKTSSNNVSEKYLFEQGGDKEDELFKALK